MWAVCYRTKLVDPSTTNNAVEGIDSQIKTNMGLEKKTNQRYQKLLA